MTKQLAVLIDGAEIGHVTQDMRVKFHFTCGDAYRQAPTMLRFQNLGGDYNLHPCP